MHPMIGEAEGFLQASMFDVVVVPRGRRWEWQVRNDKNAVLIIGSEKVRLAARYQAYRALFLLLACPARRAA